MQSGESLLNMRSILRGLNHEETLFPGGSLGNHVLSQIHLEVHSDQKVVLPSEVVKAVAGRPPASQLVSSAGGGQNFPMTLALGAIV